MGDLQPLPWNVVDIEPGWVSETGCQSRIGAPLLHGVSERCPLLSSPPFFFEAWSHDYHVIACGECMSGGREPVSGVVRAFSGPNLGYRAI